MVKRDREYRVVENISIICFAIGLVIACITRFILFIYISVISVPISFWIISKNKVGGGESHFQQKKGNRNGILK